MKRLLVSFAAALGLAALWRALRRRRVEEPPLAPPAEPDPRAAELRAKLDEAKEAAGDREEFESGETPVDEADLAARRDAVHDAGRAAIDEMGGGSGESDA